MTTPLILRDADRKKAKLRLGVSAPSGAGKTMGALLLAYGIMKSAYPDLPDPQIWQKIGMIDTEEGSGELYVGKLKYGVVFHKYKYCRLSAPFTAVRYLEAQRLMENAGIEVIIHDSLTHAWSGTGGLLEKQGRLTDADPRKNSYTAWRHVTPDHNALVDAMLHSPAHIVATMRSKVDYAMQTGKSGKQEVVKLGMAPIQREGMEFEFTLFLDINQDSIAKATKDRTDLFSTVNAAGFLEKREFIITPATGTELHKWLDTGLESLDVLSEILAKDIAVSTDLEATWATHADTIARIESERPEWLPLIQGLFENRNKELQNTA